MAKLTDNTNQTNQTQISDKRITSKKKDIVINQLHIVSIQRAQWQIDSFRNAHINASSKYNPNRCQLYDIFDDILLDGNLSGVTSKRFDTVLNKPIQYLDAEGAEVEDMDKLIRSREFSFVIRTILETRLWGVSGIEFVPGNEFHPRLIPRKHIKPERQVIAIEQNSLDGIDYTDLANIWIIGEAEDLGLLLKCAPYALYKRAAMGDWAQFIEMFGQPIRIGRYDGYDQQQKVELKNMIEQAGSSLAMIIPKEAQFEVLDGKQTNGDGQLQGAFIEALNREMSVIILGNTETTTNGQTGSQAKSKVHQEQQLEITKSDIAYIETWLNDVHFINILKSYGFPVTEGGYFEFEKDIDIQNVSEKIGVIQKVREMGTPVSNQHIYDITGIPNPEEDAPGDKPAKQQKAAKGKKKQQSDDANANDLAHKISHLLLENLGSDFFA